MEERWYAVNPTGELKEFYKPNPDYVCSYWIKKINTGRQSTTSYGNVFVIYKYEVYNAQIEKFYPEKDGWKIIRMQDYDHKNSYQYGIKLEVCDPIGELKTITCNDKEEKGVFAAMILLDKLAVHRHWTGYSIELEKENCEKRINDLEEKIKTFEQTEFFIKLKSEVELIEKKVEEEASTIMEIAERVRECGLDWEFYNSWLKEDGV